MSVLLLAEKRNRKLLFKEKVCLLYFDFGASSDYSSSQTDESDLERLCVLLVASPPALVVVPLAVAR